MSTASLLKFARMQVGYVEQPVNHTKYGRQFGLDPALWCMMFVWCCFENSGNHGLVTKTASTRELFAAAKRGDLGMKFLPPSTMPRPGDLVEYDLGGEFKPVNHVGVVEELLPGGGFLAIEGNANNRVARKNSNAPDRRGKVVNFVRPALIGPPQSSLAVEQPPAFPGLIKRGASGPIVKQIQARLNHFGKGKHDVLGGKPLPVGGHFGPMTEKVVKVFQQHRGLEDDGKVGQKTWARLFG